MVKCEVPSSFLIFAVLFISVSPEEDKYSKNDQSSLKGLDRPFRMGKVNAVWEKAKLRLNDDKLNRIFDALKFHDKEEAHLKQLKAEGKDKEGLLEAKLRNKLNAIMVEYSLLDPSRLESGGDFMSKTGETLPYSNEQLKRLSKPIIKDKKLQKLWSEAEHAGMPFEDLLVLKENIALYEEKKEEMLKSLLDNDSNEVNALDFDLDKHKTKLNSLHNELKSDLKRIQKLATLRGQKVTKDDVHRDGFTHSRATALWKLARASNYTEEELAPLKEELHIFEKRLRKLELLHAERNLKKDQKLQMGLVDEESIRKDFGDERMDEFTDAVEKHYQELQDRIFARHQEL